jgi:septum formation protein
MQYILASKSPRRREILENLGVKFEIVTAETDESDGETNPCLLVERLSARKGEAVRNLLASMGRPLDDDTVIISSDTVVSVDGNILGKPKNREDAYRMLKLLSGRAHQVVSGISLIGKNVSATAHEVTDVCFDELDEETLARYLDSSEPYDKAGAYAIQGQASLWISGMKGCYFNVVGLPVHRLSQLHVDLFGKKIL